MTRNKHNNKTRQELNRLLDWYTAFGREDTPVTITPAQWRDMVGVPGFTVEITPGQAWYRGFRIVQGKHQPPWE